MNFYIKQEEIEISEQLSTTSSTDSGLSIKSQKRRRSSDSDEKFNFNTSIQRTGRAVSIKPVDPSTKCLSHATCRRITDEMRTEINKYFTNLPYEEKRNFISTSVLCSKINNELPSGKYARKHSNEYHLYWTDISTGQFYNFNVCRSMFVNTIGITPWTMRNWLGENLAVVKRRSNSNQENIDPKVVKPRKSGRKSTKIVKIEEQPCKKFKSMLLARYLNEINSL